MGISIVEKHNPREYSAFMSDNGVVLCDKYNGAFLVLRYASDLDKLKELLDKITMIDTEL